MRRQIAMRDRSIPALAIVGGLMLATTFASIAVLSPSMALLVVCGLFVGWVVFVFERKLIRHIPSPVLIVDTSLNDEDVEWLNNQLEQVRHPIFGEGKADA